MGRVWWLQTGTPKRGVRRYQKLQKITEIHQNGAFWIHNPRIPACWMNKKRDYWFGEFENFVNIFYFHTQGARMHVSLGGSECAPAWPIPSNTDRFRETNSWGTGIRCKSDEEVTWAQRFHANICRCRRFLTISFIFQSEFIGLVGQVLHTKLFTLKRNKC